MSSSRLRGWLVAIAFAAASAAGCGETLRNPFAGFGESPVETALAASKGAIESAAEWYTDACVLKVEGLAAPEDVCLLYRNEVAPPVHAAHNAAVRTARDLRAGASATLVSLDVAIEAITRARSQDSSPPRRRNIWDPLLKAARQLRAALAKGN